MTLIVLCIKVNKLTIIIPKYTITICSHNLVSLNLVTMFCEIQNF